MGRKTIILSLIIAAAFILRLVNLNQSFWLDEAAQMIESLRPLDRQFDLAADFHPPLYHLLLHFWLKLGANEIIGRLFSVFLGTASVWVIYLAGRHLKNETAGILAALLLAVSPYHIYYSQEVRPYMLFAFLSLLSIYLWLKKSWRKYALVNILMLYTNYFSLFLLCGQLISAAILRKKTLKANLLYAFVSGLFFIPWLPKMFRQMEVGLGGGFSGWTSVVSESTLRNAPLLFAKFILGHVSFDNNLVYAAVLLPSLTVFFYSCYLAFRERKGVLLPGLFFISFFLALAVSVFFPVTAPQRLIFLLPVFYLIIVRPLSRPAVNTQTVLYSVVLVTSVLGLFMYYSFPRFQREDWRSSVSFIEKSSVSSHLVVFAFPEPFAPFIWYNGRGLNAFGAARDFRMDDENILELQNRIIPAQEVYYYSYLDDLTDPEGRIHSIFDSSGYSVKEVRDFTGVGFVYRYEK